MRSTELIAGHIGIVQLGDVADLAEVVEIVACRPEGIGPRCRWGERHGVDGADPDASDAGPGAASGGEPGDWPSTTNVSATG
jgi:hypothetical protein